MACRSPGLTSLSWFLFVVGFSSSAFAQQPPSITVTGSQTLNGGTFSTVTVTQTGNLIGNNLTLAAGTGGGVTKVSVSGAASLMNTAINMDPGGAGRGIIANGAGATVVLGSGSLISQTQIFSGSNIGAFANGGTVTLQGGASVNMATGGSSSAAQASGVGGIFNMSGGSLAVTGNSGSNAGLTATTDATANLENASVTVTTGAGGSNAGALITTGAVVNVAGGSVTLNSTGFDSAVQLTNGGTIHVSGGTVQKTGANGQAILVSGSGTNFGAFDGTAVTTDHGDGIRAQDSANSTLNFANGASLTAGSGVLLRDVAGGTVNVNGTNNVNFVGDIDATGASGVANVILRQNSSLRGAINQNQLTGAIDIAPAQSLANLPKQNVSLDIDPSVWNMTASSTLGQLTVTSGSIVAFPSPNGDSFHTLVARNLAGDGGIFQMNVDLPAFRGDLLVVQTPTTGFHGHQLQISNPDQSRDPEANRALLVVISNQSTGLVFPSNQVEAGTFKYVTQRGNDTAVTPDPQNWYLVRADQTSAPPPGSSPPGGGPESTPATGPGFPGEGQIDFPPSLDPVQALTNTANAAIGTFSGAVPLYYVDMQTLVQRMGELRLGRVVQSPVTPSPEPQPGGKEVVESKQVAAPPAPEPDRFEGSAAVPGSITG